MRVVLRLDPRWARFAPLTSAGVVLAAGVIGVGSQILDGLGAWDQLNVDVAVDEPSREWLFVALLLVVGVAVLVSALAVAGYLMTNWDFTLSHSAADHSWHLRRGLTTTRETSLDDERVSGVSIGEPLGLRLTGGGRLSAIVTGLDRKQQGSSVLVPPAPREVVEGVAGEVLGSHAPVTESAAAARRPRSNPPLDQGADGAAGHHRCRRGRGGLRRLESVGARPGGAAGGRGRRTRRRPRRGRSGTPWSDGTSWSARAASTASARPSRPAR